METSAIPHSGDHRQHSLPKTRVVTALICLAVHIAIISALVMTYIPRNRIKGLAEIETSVSLIPGRSRVPAATVQPAPEKHFAKPQAPAAISAAPAAEPHIATNSQTAAQPAEEGFQIGETMDANAHNSDFRDILLRHIANFRHYPSAALAPRLSGTAHIAFTINRTGGLLAAWLQTSSGSDILDAEALETIHRSQPFPPIPSDLPDPLTATLPVSFVPPP